MNNIIIPPINGHEHAFLMKRWGIAAESLMNRDGTDPEYGRNGHRIKQNPLLIAAIEQIRNGYFQLFNEQRFFKAQYKKEINNRKWEIQIENCEYDMITHTHESYLRLQEPDFGFSPEEKTAIMTKAAGQGNNEATSLQEHDARALIGSIIKRSITAFRETFPRAEKLGVPRVKELKNRPEEDGRFRKGVRKRDGRFGEKDSDWLNI